MNRRMIAIAVGGIAIAATSLGTAFALPSHPSSHSGAFRFVAEQTAHRNFKGHFIGGDKDVSGGHTIGVDTLQCIVSSDGSTGKCDVAASFRRGQLYGTFTQSFKDGSLAGKVTGGTRMFEGATGTIKGQALSDTQEKISVTYQAP
jgi:hypothetical protein